MYVCIHIYMYEKTFMRADQHALLYEVSPAVCVAPLGDLYMYMVTCMYIYFRANMYTYICIHIYIYIHVERLS